MPDYVRRSINQSSPDVIEYQAIQYSPDDIEIRLALTDDANRASVEEAIVTNLAYWARRAGGSLGAIRFSDTQPTRDPVTHKLVRVMRRPPR